MHVSKKYHYRVVLALSAGLVILLALLIVTFFRIGIVSYLITPTPYTEKDASSLRFTAPPSGFLSEEEVVIVEPASEEEVILPVQKVLYEYVEVINSCAEHFEGECVNVRSGPGTDYPSITKLRNNIVLKVGGKVERDGQTWIKIVFDEWLRYPERVQGDWYVSADYLEVVLDEGDRTIWEHGKATTTKEIIVDRKEQKLYAYEDGKLFMELSVSTGLEFTPTPRGTFTVFKKTPSRYMQGPLPSLPADQYYDLPGVPWNLYFTEGGAVIHGAYWHKNFGSPYSHGCVNLPPEEAQKLYTWAELGTKVIVKN